MAIYRDRLVKVACVWRFSYHLVVVDGHG